MGLNPLSPPPKKKSQFEEGPALTKKQGWGGGEGTLPSARKNVTFPNVKNEVGLNKCDFTPYELLALGAREVGVERRRERNTLCHLSVAGRRLATMNLKTQLNPKVGFLSFRFFRVLVLGFRVVGLFRLV